MKRFVDEEKMEGEKESVLQSDGEEQISGAYTLFRARRTESEEELFRAGVSNLWASGGTLHVGNRAEGRMMFSIWRSPLLRTMVSVM